MYWGGYSYLDIVQEVFMKRTIIAVISIGLILFAFSACRPTVVGIPVDPTPDTPTPDPSVKDVSTYEALRAALIDPEIKTINLTVPMELTTAQIEDLEFNREGITLNGNKNVITVTAGTTPSTAGAPAKPFNINGASITFKNVKIEVKDTNVCAWLINVNADDFIFEGGSITGVINSNNSGSTVNMGICIGANTTGTIIRDTILEGSYSPVYASSDAFTIDNVTFEKGMELEVVSDKTMITNCKEIEDTKYPAEIHIKNGTEDDILALLRFISEEGNNTITAVKADGKTYNQILADDISDFVDDVSKSSVETEMETAVKNMGDNVLASGTLPDDLSVFNLLQFLSKPEEVAAVMAAAKGSSGNGLDIVISDYSISAPVGFTIEASATDYAEIFKTEGFKASGNIKFTFTGELKTSYENYGMCFVCDSYTASSDDIELISPAGDMYDVVFDNFIGSATLIIDPKNAVGETPARIDFIISDFSVPTPEETDPNIIVNGYDVEYADIYAGTDQGATTEI